MDEQGTGWGARRRWRWVIALVIGSCWAWVGVGRSPLVQAQTLADRRVVPDATLGTEGSVIREVQGDRLHIEGGAVRGRNLFHSFREFGIELGGSVYFTNPAGIENILSRVTGRSPSDIQGTLGVLGNANLFLLNPNGIIFGPDARLDIRGSFVASTGDRFAFADGSEFSAVDPQAPPLLTVAVPIGLQPGEGHLASEANLTTGADLSLAGRRLDLTGELQAGGQLTLVGQEVILGDRPDLPLVVTAQEGILIQGNEQVLIQALSHANSGVTAGGDLVLRSGQPITTDARFWSGGSFRIEGLTEAAGDLQSPNDPVIRALGDVVFDAYEGASLHIFAGGRVEAEQIVITGADTTGTAIAETDILLSDGETTLDIDGTVQPTLDVRAGMTPAAIGMPAIIGTPSPLDPAPLPTEPSHSFIRIGEIAVNAPDGLVFLTNQYQPNLTLPDGNVRVEVLETGTQRRGTNVPVFTGRGGAVVFDARGNIRVGDRLDASSATGLAGDITLLAVGEVRLDGSRITTNNLGTGRGGDIVIRAAELDGDGSAQIESSTFGEGDAGRIDIIVEGDVEFTGQRTGVINSIRQGGDGNGGGIWITAGDDIILGNGAQLQARVGDVQNPNFRPLPSVGTAGNITLIAGDRVVLRNAARTNSTSAITSIERQGTGEAGDIFIQGRLVDFVDGGRLQSNTLGNGPAGNIRIEAQDRVSLSGRRNNSSSEIFTRINGNGVGDAGDIVIHVSDGIMELGRPSRLISSAIGTGRGGNITVTAQEDITIGSGAQVTTTLSEIGLDSAGDIYIESRQGTVEADGENRNVPVEILSTTSGDGNGGTITLVGGDRIFLHGNVHINSDLATGQMGDVPMRAGDIRLRADTIVIAEDVEIAARTSGLGNGGNIDLLATDQIILEDRVDVRTEVAEAGRGNAGGIRLQAENGIRLFDQVELAATVTQGGVGDAGNVELESMRGSVVIDGNNRRNPTRVLAETEGLGSGGNITITAADTIYLQNQSRVRSDRRDNGQAESRPFNAGNILLDARQIEVHSIVEIETRTDDLGSGGSITLRGRDGINFSDFIEVRSEVLRQGVGNAGDITLEAAAGSITAFDEVFIAASVRGQGNSGQVRIAAQDGVDLEQDVVVRSTLEGGGVGQAGSIDVTANTLLLRNGAQLAVRTEGTGDAGDITINVADRVSLDGAGNIPRQTGIFSSVEPGAFGNGGEITVVGRSLSVTNRARVDASTRSLGTAGNVTVRTTDAVRVASDGAIFSGVDDGATGNGGAIDIETRQLTLESGGRIETRTLGFIPQILAEQQEGVDYGESVLGDDPAAYWPLDEATGADVAGDRSGQGFDGTYDGAVTPGQPGVSGTAAEFDSLGSAVTIGEIAPDSALDVQQGPFTIEAWIHPNANPPEEQVFFALHDRNGFMRSLNLGVREDGSLRFGFFNDDLETAPGTIPFGEWTHVVVRYDRAADLSTVYINGMPVANGAQGAFRGETPTARIGSWRNQNNQPFDGLIDEVVFYDGLLSPQSIAERFFIGRANLGQLVPNLATTGANAGSITIRADRVDISGVSATQDQASGLLSGTEGVASGRGGPISLTTGLLRVTDRGVVSAVTQNQSQGGSVEITADTLSLETGGQILTTAFDRGDAGGINLNVGDRLSISGQSATPTADNDGNASGIFGRTEARGDGGTLVINTGQLTLADGAAISVSTAGAGQGGSVQITATDGVTLTQSQVTASTSATGQGGDISLSGDRITLRDNAQITASTTGAGRGGAIALDATTAVELHRSQIAASTTGTGRGGDIEIQGDRISAQDQSQITASTSGPGDGGTVSLQADDRVDLAQSEISASTLGSGEGGDIEITGDRLTVQDQSQITAATSGTGSGGTISLRADDTVALRNSEVTASTTGSGQGGDIEIQGDRLTVENQSQITAATSGTGSGGTISLRGDESVDLFGSDVSASTTDSGRGGDIEIQGDRISAQDQSQITASTSGPGNGGTVSLQADDAVALSNSEVTASTTGSGQGGDIEIRGDRLTVENQSQITAATSGTGSGGTISLRGDESVDLFGSDVSASTTDSGRGGDIEIQGDRISAQDQSQITASTSGPGNGGTVSLQADDAVALSNSEVTASTTGSGQGGDIEIRGDRLTVENQSQIAASTSGDGNGGTLNLRINDRVNLGNSQISASTSGQGRGGDIDLTTTRLRINGQGQITASTTGAGAGGEIQINADRVAISGDGAEISASTSGSGVGGDIDLTTGRLQLRAGGRITASTSGAGRGGDIVIEATDAIRLQGTSADGRSASGIFSTAEVGAGDRGGTLSLVAPQLTLQENAVISAVTRSSGQGGNIDLTVDRLDITGGGQVLTTAFAAGDAGLIDIRATDQVRLQGLSPMRTDDNTGDRRTTTVSGIFANTQGAGDAGQRLRIRADQALIVEDGAQISAATSGQGNGGRIDLTTNRLTLQTGGEIAASTTRRQSGGDAGEIEIEANQVIIDSNGAISTSTAGAGDAGQVTLRANQLTLTQGGQLATTTGGEGDAGDLDLQVRDRIAIDGPTSGLFASTTRSATGNGGSIFIDPELVTLNNGARIAVNSEGTGIGGNITLQAGQLFLDNGSAISAETASNQGGNVTLLLDDALVLRRGSTLSANAGTNPGGDRQGDGGNITIRADLVVAVPAENSDISANAVAGDGGRVSIFAPFSIYGIEFREFATPLSDITVSSEFGGSGTVSLEIPDVDPSQGLAELPSEPVEPEISSACQAQGAETGSEFVNTGRGGLPPTPSDSSAEASNAWEDLRPLPEVATQPQTTSAPDPSRPPPLATQLAGQMMLEVQGWRIDEQGQVRLTADSPTVVPYSSLRSPQVCPPPSSVQRGR